MSLYSYIKRQANKAARKNTSSLTDSLNQNLDQSTPVQGQVIALSADGLSATVQLINGDQITAYMGSRWVQLGDAVVTDGSRIF